VTLAGSILVTGGSGSLGTAIIERAHDEGWDARFTVYSRDEVKQSALRERFPDVIYRLGDIRDHGALARAMRGVDTVIHAAAYKRVPEAETETIACAQSNVDGSIAVIDAALTAHVRRVIGISTDKACHPINAYGMTKALMERLFQSVALSQTATAFHLVRYGNVLASRGSVIPMLLDQAKRGKPVTLTDPKMTRFWLTLDDAVDLILSSLDAAPGEVVIPMAASAPMADIIRAVVPDAEVCIVGPRAAEKTHESLMNADESPYARAFGKGWAIGPMSLPPVRLYPEGFAYTSEHAPRIEATELRWIMESMARGDHPRTLS